MLVFNYYHQLHNLKDFLEFRVCYNKFTFKSHPITALAHKSDEFLQSHVSHKSIMSGFFLWGGANQLHVVLF